ncbi:hypothetical protein DFH07DRAFT_756513 [Mycena maculata]|uniref:F-box domain-containing protein n=1 Tax=Mycena maculata TaxID=230809 RepID=A0AAD7HY70_9AGAR|nr:hypothetical protein DFH07DRAFT_756513 [Mycena maculata]
MYLFETDSKESSSNKTPVHSDILETNNPPTEFQIPSIHDFLSSAHAQKSSPDDKIALLQSSLKKLRAEHHSLNIQIRNHGGAVSPLRRMPTENSSLIFSLTITPHHPWAESALWLVSAVSARWRNIVLSQPSLGHY